MERRTENAEGGAVRRAVAWAHSLKPAVAVVLVLAIAAAALLIANLARGGGSGSPSSTAVRSSPAPDLRNPIQMENARRGTSAWQTPAVPDGAIEGYASNMSVAPGETVMFHVSTNPPARYSIRVYRLGWYGGAGGRLITCLPSCSATEAGQARPVPAPDASGEINAGWPVTDQAPVGADWVSGYYFAKLVLASGPHSGGGATIPFVVRAPAARHAAVLVQVPVNTWQAYNGWGGKSLYSFNSSGNTPATRVSFERPILETDILNYPTTYEYPLVRFLEREGYDVQYATDVDTHTNPGDLTSHRVVMTAGHDEYWSKEMRDGFDAARDAGTNLMFMGGNTGVWQVRYEDGNQTIVAYKEQATAKDPIGDPNLQTARFRDLASPRAECELVGIESQKGLAGADDPPRAYTPTAVATTDPWFAGTGLSPGQQLVGLVGYEWDTPKAGCAVPPLTILFEYKGTPSNAEAIRYTAPSGARVFAAGAMPFSWGLDNWGNHHAANQGVQRFMQNALDDLSRTAR